jgi:hypothetical protein
MSRLRKRRRYLRWCRYANRYPFHAGATWGLARAGAPFYRNGATLPYGWAPRRTLTAQEVTDWVEYNGGVTLTIEQRSLITRTCEQ